MTVFSNVKSSHSFKNNVTVTEYAQPSLLIYSPMILCALAFTGLQQLCSYFLCNADFFSMYMSSKLNTKGTMEELFDASYQEPKNQTRMTGEMSGEQQKLGHLVAPQADKGEVSQHLVSQ